MPLRRRHLIPCVLHLLIFVGRQVTALVRRLAKSVRPSTRVSVQAILHRSGCHIALQGTAEPDGEDTWCLLKVWEDLAPLLGGDMRMHTAVVAMYILLGDMYGTMFEEGALQASEVAQAFQRWVCPEIREPRCRRKEFSCACCCCCCCLLLLLLQRVAHPWTLKGGVKPRQGKPNSVIKTRTRTELGPSLV